MVVAPPDGMWARSALLLWVVACGPAVETPSMSNNRRRQAATLSEALTIALLDEYKARATYRQVLSSFGPIHPFSNIVGAEGRHARALEALFEGHGLERPADPWQNSSTRLPEFATVHDACVAAIAAEHDNIAMYSRLLQLDLPVDVDAVFRRLQDASRSNHLTAFERCARRTR